MRALEMRTAQTFRAAGSSVVQQSQYYTDPETGDQREIDVIAREAAVLSFDPLVFVAVDFRIECKSHSPDRPFVVFSAPMPEVTSGWRWLNCAGSVLGKKLIDYLDPELVGLEVFAVEPLTGYGLAQAALSNKGGNQDAGFSATMQAAKASCAGFSEPGQCVLSFPVVVVTGPLYDCHLGDDGEPVVSEVRQHAIQVPYPLKNGPAVNTVRIVTEAGLPEFAKSGVASAKSLLGAYKKLDRALYQETLREIRDGNRSTT